MTDDVQYCTVIGPQVIPDNEPVGPPELQFVGRSSPWRYCFACARPAGHPPLHRTVEWGDINPPVFEWADEDVS